MMKILVPVKRVIDAYVKVRVKSDSSGVDLNNIKMDINPFCEIAVEEAIRMKENNLASEIILVSIGGSKSEETLRKGLAMGADRAILIDCGDQELEPLSIAKILKEIATKEAVDLVLMGKQAIDSDNNQTGQMLSALLGWSQGTFVSEVKKDDDGLIVTREVDGGLETISLTIPAVITADLRLNEPRYVKLPNIMKAKKKPLDKMVLADLSIDTTARTKTLKVEEPVARTSGELFEGAANDTVAKLIEKIGNKL